MNAPAKAAMLDAKCMWPWLHRPVNPPGSMAEGPVYTPTFGDDLWRDLEGLLDIFAGVKPEKKNLTLL